MRSFRSRKELDKLPFRDFQIYEPRLPAFPGKTELNGKAEYAGVELDGSIDISYANGSMSYAFNQDIAPFNMAD